MEMVLFRDEVTTGDTTIKVGDWVSFKQRISHWHPEGQCFVGGGYSQQSGKVLQIQLRAYTWRTRKSEYYILVLENKEGFHSPVGQLATKIKVDITDITEVSNECK